MNLAEACDRAVESLGPTPSRDVLCASCRAGDAPGGLLRRVPPAERCLIALALTATGEVRWGASEVTREIVEALGEVELAELLDPMLLQRWVIAASSSHRAWLRPVLRAHRQCGSVIVWTVARLAGEGDVAGAEDIVELTWGGPKATRALALLEVALARGVAWDFVIETIEGTEVITTGPDRGHDESFALTAVLERLLREPGRLPDLLPVVAPIARHGRQGQGRSRPKGWANELADVATRCAHAATADRRILLEHAKMLRDAIVLDDVASVVTSTIARAEQRVAEGVAGPLPDEPRWEPVLPTDTRWREEDTLAGRARQATAVMVAALDRRDWVGYFDALAVALDPAGIPYAARVRNWAAASGSDAEALLVATIEYDPTPDHYWCVQSVSEPWEAIAAVASPECARRLVKLLIERDFLTRAYPVGGSWRSPRSISIPAAELCARHKDVDMIMAMVAHFLASTRVGADFRFFDALLVLGRHRIRLDPEPFLAGLSAPRRWALWGSAPYQPASAADMRAMLGDPNAATLGPLCGTYAAEGRVDEAIALSETEVASLIHDNHYGTTPPPTQAALLAIAKSGVELSKAQRTELVRRMKEAPRRPREGHLGRLAQLRELLG